MPTGSSVWTAPRGATLTPTSPVTVTFDNGEGLVFTRTFSVDEDYLFTVRDEVRNATNAASCCILTAWCRATARRSCRAFIFCMKA